MLKKVIAPFIILLSLSCSAPPQDEAVIRKQIQAFFSAFDAKDMKMLINMSTEDMYWYTLNGKALSRNDMTEFFSQMFSRWQSTQTSVSDLQLNLQPEMAAARFKTSMVIRYEKSESTIKNVHTMIFIRHAQQWPLWQHHMSTE